MSSDQNNYIYIDNTKAEISSIPIEYYKVVKKYRYSKMKKQLKRLENKYDILDNDLLELKWEIDDIKKNLLKFKSNSSDNEDSSDDIKYHVLHNQE